MMVEITWELNYYKKYWKKNKYYFKSIIKRQFFLMIKTQNLELPGLDLYPRSAT